MWICTGSQYSETPHSCEHCSHGINNLFFICNTETGASMVVGSDCVFHFCSSTSEQPVNVKLQERRVSRASRQWRENKPARRENESKEVYVNRRLVEMGNAMKAFNAWMKLFDRKSPSFFWQIDQRMKAKGLANTHENYQAEQDAFYAEFEAAQQANRFDFSRAIWDVRKI